MTYYRHPKRHVWHWMVTCSSWRRICGVRLVETHTRPQGDLCNECKAKARRP